MNKLESKSFYNSVKDPTKKRRNHLPQDIVLISLIILSIIFFIKCKQNKNESDITYIKIEIVNASGVDSLTSKFTDSLREKNFDVVLLRNDTENIIEKSYVIDRIDNLEYANEVASALGIEKENVKKEIDKNLLVDVTVVIGKDYKKLIH